MLQCLHFDSNPRNNLWCSTHLITMLNFHWLVSLALIIYKLPGKQTTWEHLVQSCWVFSRVHASQDFAKSISSQLVGDLPFHSWEFRCLNRKLFALETASASTLRRQMDMSTVSRAGTQQNQYHQSKSIHSFLCLIDLSSMNDFLYTLA